MMENRVIIIGASSGIGRQIASKYVAAGWMVGITGRRWHLLEELRQAHPDQVFSSCFDVMESECHIMIDHLIREMGGLDLFIYNSGIGDLSAELNENIEITTTRTNVLGFVSSVAFVFNYFIRQGKGQIAVISSMAALRGSSWAPAYSASKAFMSNYAEGLNLKAFKMKLNIVVTDIRPGFVNTKMSKGNKRFWVATPEKAAEQIIRAIRGKKRVAYITRRWVLLAPLMRIIPFSVFKRLG